MMTIGKAIWTYGDGKAVYKIHLTAAEGTQLTRDGENLFGAVDVDSIVGWYEIDFPEEEDEL